MHKMKIENLRFDENKLQFYVTLSFIIIPRFGTLMVLFVKLQFVFSDIGGMLVHSVLKSNQIAQQVISDGAKAKQNGGNQVFILPLWF